MKWLQTEIGFLEDITQLERIEKGFSKDKKYIAKKQSGQSYLVRVGDFTDLSRREEELQLLQQLIRYGVHAPKPVETGVISRAEIQSYSIVHFIPGKDAKRILPLLTKEEQYQIGYQAGQDLWRMHQLEAPADMEPWDRRCLAKHKRYLQQYLAGALHLNNDEKVIQFIEKHQHLVNNRPNRFQHDDFHLENIIVYQNRYHGAVDFNGFDWGDPWHDFVKVALFARDISIPFSIGQIRGYFNKEIPENFWDVYALYVAMTIISSIVWSVQMAPQQLDSMLERLELVMEDHQNFTMKKPVWFVEKYSK
ncbi:aminoglycoside phosphotransferase family protein [Gracilibacillus alcaliphilus]|nr:aminoglycoside phosphotransferase family protein [Gracilibacillus alcaliphilus]